ncbi:MAG: DoxX family protein, partial [Bacteroidota bacterium]|nr:DoxX family protein [Bacteroidota bacterium]
FEVVAGVAIIVGWQSKLFSRLLLLLILFFTFLTGYATLSGRFTSCGCFGDCLPLSPLQSFIKDLVLMVLIVIIFINKSRIQPLFQSKQFSIAIILVTVISVMLFQSYVLKYLPALDCLPYKKGNDIIEQMKVPAGAVSDSFAMTFQYKKDGKKVEFDEEHFPPDFDSTYEFINRYDKLIRKGTATPPITDFALQTINGNDTTAAILQQPKYVLVFIQNFEQWNQHADDFAEISNACKAAQIPLFIVTPNPQQAALTLLGTNILRCDATVLKTAARVIPTYFVMKKAVIELKESYASKNKILRYLHSIQ